MKLTKITSAVLALAFAAVLSTSARAQIAYNPGDVLLGFENGGANNYVVDLGGANQFIDATYGSTLTFNINTTDLTTAFGSSWASNSGTVQWGLVSASNPNSNLVLGSDTLKKNTLFFSEGEQVPGTQSTPFPTSSNSGQGNIQSNITAFTQELLNYANTSANAEITPSTDATGWTGNAPSTSAFGSGFAIEQTGSGLNTGPTNSELDFYQLNNTTSTPGATAKDLGNFTLNSSGVLTFSATPEPSSIALSGMAMTLMTVLVLRRRKALGAE